MQAILTNSQALHQEAEKHNMPRWKLQPKHHMLLEMWMYVTSTGVNPGYFWCFGDEHHVGVAAKVASKCHKSTATASYLLRFIESLRMEYERW